MRKPLQQPDITARLAAMPGWSQEGNTIRKTCTFKNFAAAVGFINAVAVCAEKMDHHPDLLLHGWNKVDVILSTHDAKGITENDFALAAQIDGL